MRLITIFLCSLMLAMTTGAGQLAAQSVEFFKRVTVVDAESNVIGVIGDELRLLEFAAHWAVRLPILESGRADTHRAGSRTAVPGTVARRADPRDVSAYRLDLVSSSGSTQWRYRPAGRLEAIGEASGGNASVLDVAAVGAAAVGGPGVARSWTVADPDAFNRLLGLPTR